MPMAVVREKGQREHVIIRTFREVRSEMKNVVWPTRDETIRLTAVVIAISAVISVILFTADSVYALLLTLLQSAVK
jgi:preprotein translocase subunit SecE